MITTQHLSETPGTAQDPRDSSRKDRDQFRDSPEDFEQVAARCRGRGRHQAKCHLGGAGRGKDSCILVNDLAADSDSHRGRSIGYRRLLTNPIPGGLLPRSGMPRGRGLTGRTHFSTRTAGDPEFSVRFLVHEGTWMGRLHGIVCCPVNVAGRCGAGGIPCAYGKQRQEESGQRQEGQAHAETVGEAVCTHGPRRDLYAKEPRRRPRACWHA